ncbi:hypothetical protein B0H14DRAFT_2565164 [Mycena olivaceomarginata]|nr:hypothetical protein B0H14DRAFT_2565164 [Mycena olivaceomarginata]
MSYRWETFYGPTWELVSIGATCMMGYAAYLVSGTDSLVLTGIAGLVGILRVLVFLGLSALLNRSFRFYAYCSMLFVISALGIAAAIAWPWYTFTYSPVTVS